MEELIQQLRQYLAQVMPGSEFLPEVAPPRLAGVLIWDGFAGKEPLDRQAELRGRLDQLDAATQMKLSFILTFTRDEYDSIQRFHAEAG